MNENEIQRTRRTNSVGATFTESTYEREFEFFDKLPQPIRHALAYSNSNFAAFFLFGQLVQQGFDPDTDIPLVLASMKEAEERDALLINGPPLHIPSLSEYTNSRKD